MAQTLLPITKWFFNMKCTLFSFSLSCKFIGRLNRKLNLFEVKLVGDTDFRFSTLSAQSDERRMKSFYTAVHSTVAKFLDANGYSEVSLTKLFSDFAF